MDTKTFGLLCLLSLAGCAHGGSTVSGGGHSYGATARENYERGMKALSDKDFEGADRYLSFVSTKFPYSRYSALSQLGLADLDFVQERYLEAIAKYQDFVKMHPTHPKDAYAAYQVGECYYQQMPSSFFLLPAPATRDQTDEHKALLAFNAFLANYPTSGLRPKAQARVKKLRHELADHEMRVGDFYLHHDRPRSAVGRYQGILSDYGDTDLAGPAALKLYRVYLKLGEPDKAKATLKRFVGAHPHAKEAAQARELLRS